jgi:hypothetical protein
MNCDLYRSEMYGIPCRHSSFAQTFRERGLCRSSCGSKSSGDCDLVTNKWGPRCRLRLNFQFRVEGFNALNSPQFSNPNAVFGTAAFGSITSNSINNQEIQLAGRLT